MLPPTYVRTLTAEEQQHLTAGLRSPEAFVLRRCQIVLASARRERAPQIARSLGCSDQCVRNARQAFTAHGLGALARGSTRPKTSRAAFTSAQAERLLARPALHAWSETTEPLRLQELTVPKDDPNPKALACYGLLVRLGGGECLTGEQIWLRFVEGRPVSGQTIQFLDWCSAELEKVGK